MLLCWGMFLYLYVFKPCYKIIKQIEKLLIIAMYLRIFEDYWKYEFWVVNS